MFDNEIIDDQNLNISVISKYSYQRSNAAQNSIQADINLLVLSQQNLRQISQDVFIQQNPNPLNKFEEPQKSQMLIYNSHGSLKYQITPKNRSDTTQNTNNVQEIEKPQKLEYYEEKFKPKFFKPYLISALIIFILCIITFVNYTNVGTLITQIFVFILISIISAYYYKVGIKNQDIFNIKAKNFSALFIFLIILCFIALIVSISVQDQYAFQIVNFIVSLFQYFYYNFRVRQYRRHF